MGRRVCDFHLRLTQSRFRAHAIHLQPKKGGRGGDDDDGPSGPGAKARAAKDAAQRAKDAAAAAKKEADDAKAWEDGANTKAMRKKEAEAAAAAERAARKKEADEQARKEEEEAKAQRLRGAEKVAARKAQEHHGRDEEQKRLAAPALEARSIEAAIAVLSIATNDAPAAGGAGAGAGADDASHAEDARKAAALARQLSTPGGGVKEDDKHPEKRMKAAFKRFEERMLAELKEEFPTVRGSSSQQPACGGGNLGGALARLRSHHFRRGLPLADPMPPRPLAHRPLLLLPSSAHPRPLQLRRSQLNEMVFRKWQRSSENPMNAPNPSRIGGSS